jgi:phytoene dehydrogenase-like protein
VTATQGADVVVIGAGISGLVDAILLAETGRKVVVLEQHTIPGGYLQQFTRKKTVFDVGFHYVGSTQPGRPMRQLLEHLHVWDRLTLVPFPADAAIEVVQGGRRFAYPTRFEAFAEKARRTWPGQVEAIDQVVSDCEAVCAEYAWFDLKRGRDYQHPLDLPFSGASLREHLSPLHLDPWLQEVLEAQSFNLGLFADEVPWVKHMLAFRSNFDETSRIDGGGGALARVLVARGRELGVDYRFRQEVTGFECDGREVRAVTTARGERHSAELFVAACHPKVIYRRLPDAALKPVFKERVLGMQDSRGAVQLFLRLKEPLSSMSETCLLLSDPSEVAGDPPLHAVLVTYPGEAETAARGGPRLEAMTYMHDAPFAAWRGTRVMKRGADYDALKADLARRLTAMIAEQVPELQERIADVYTATPLSDAWYTLNERGAVFGISHDVTQQGRDRPQPRTRLKNLWFTGHSIQMPGICGVFINAFNTCATLRGDDLFDQVAT